MIEITMQSGRTARIAHTGENEAVRVAFSLAPFEEAFPGGRPALLVRRKGDTQAYPVTLTVEGDTAYWTVTAADTAAAGFGQCELQWYAGDTLAKSDKFDFLVVQALEAGAEPPDEPSKRWFDAIQSQIGDLDNLTTKAKENLVAAINEAAKTGSGGAGSIDMQVSGGYIQYSTDDGTTWENLIAVANLKGEPGEDGTPGKPGEDGKPGVDGYSPVAKVEETADGAKITITDKTGTTSVNVMNGANGTPGHTPEITAEKSGKVTTIKADGTAIAEISDGSDGAPGKDGAGMDITGAAAGQIAKISAVDENGVPTAWEPVDMPGGGKTWEKIGEWTIPEGSQSISLSQQIENLNTYQQIKVFAILPVIASTAAKFRVGILFGGTSMWAIYNAGFSASRAIGALVSLFVYDDKFAVESCAGDIQSDEVIYGLSANNSYALRKSLIDNDKYRPSALSGIRIDVTNSTTDYLDGANIVMYGVRT